MLSRKLQEIRVGRIPTGYAAYEAEAGEYQGGSALSAEGLGTVAVLTVVEMVSESEQTSAENQA